jgi:hypothetical protein
MQRRKRGKGHSARRSFSGERRVTATIMVGGSERAVHSQSQSATAAIGNTYAKFHACAEVEETVETHVIPRKSITESQLLGVFPQQIETAPIPTKQLDKQPPTCTKCGKTDRVTLITDFWLCKRIGCYVRMPIRMIETTNNRVTWKSDKTLLNRTKAEKDVIVKREGLIREGLNTRKTITTEREVSPEPVIISDAADYDVFSNN